MRVYYVASWCAQTECLSDNLEVLVIITLTVTPPLHAGWTPADGTAFHNDFSTVITNAPSRLSGNILFTKYNQ